MTDHPDDPDAPPPIVPWGTETPIADWRQWVPPAVVAFIPDPVEDEEYDDDDKSPSGWQRFIPSVFRRWLDVSPAPRPQTRTLNFIGVDEDRPGARWVALFNETWPAYRKWWLRQGEATRPTRQEAESALRFHMPELIPVYEELVVLAGGHDSAAAMLTLWNPPPFIVACSQTVVPDAVTGEPVLLRNYDYDPRLFEATIYRSKWSTRRVMGTGDCLWGLVDGVNDGGLAVSLTFGGRREVGVGFGVPIVIRYILEVCDDVEAGIAVLGRIPHQVSYNVTLADRSGRVATVRVAPDRPAQVVDDRCTTNHPETVEWPEHATWVKSVERLEFLCDLQESGANADTIAAAMLEPPLLARNWDEGFSTLFTAAYRPVSGTLTYHWPPTTLALSLAGPLPETFTVALGEDDTPST